MKRFYFTLAQNHIQRHWPGRADRAGCVAVDEVDWEAAQHQMIEEFGRYWSMQYEAMDDMHPADRKILLTLTAEPPTQT